MFSINFLDRIRTFILKKVLKYNLVKSIFINRSIRLQFGFVFSASTSLYFALFHPYNLLIIGPLIFGIPHLLSSIRYLPKYLNKNDFSKNFSLIVAVLLFSFVIIKLFIEPIILNKKGVILNFTEIIFYVLFAASIFIFLKHKINFIFFIIVSFFLILFSFLAPLKMIGSLALAHNFIAFYFWHAFSVNQNERNSSIVSFCIFLLVHGLIFMGFFDHQIMYSQEFGYQNSLTQMTFGFENLFQQNSIYLSRTIAAFAFGQSVHYFVWLKAIPEQNSSFQFNLSFKLIFKKMINEVSKPVLILIALSIVFVISISFFQSLYQARFAYLLLAATHGYFEIATFLIGKKT